MTAEKPKKAFALDQGQTAFTMRDVQKVRDQDNAQLVPKPPSIFRLDHPRLAPPGMKGITRTVKAGQNVDININLNVKIEQPHAPTRKPEQRPKARIQLGDHGEAKKDFRPLLKDQSVTRER